MGGTEYTHAYMANWFSAEIDIKAIPWGTGSLFDTWSWKN